MLKAITHSYFVILGITLHETHGGYGPSRGAERCGRIFNPQMP